MWAPFGPTELGGELETPVLAAVSAIGDPGRSTEETAGVAAGDRMDMGVEVGRGRVDEAALGTDPTLAHETVRRTAISATETDGSRHPARTSTHFPAELVMYRPPLKKVRLTLKMLPSFDFGPGVLSSIRHGSR